MSREIVDIAILELSTSEGSIELQTVVSMTVNKTDPKTPVKTMRKKRRALGYMRGVPDWSIDLECVLEEGENEVDWTALKQSGERCLLTYEKNENGERITFKDVVVNEVSEPFSESGETKVAVKLIALDEKPE